MISILLLLCILSEYSLILTIFISITFLEIALLINPTSENVDINSGNMVRILNIIIPPDNYFVLLN